MTNVQRREIERHLEDMLTNLRHQAIGATEHTQCPDDNEYASRLSEMRMNATLQHRINRQVKAIEAALRRIDYADYGVCEECGENIPLARLKAKPTTTLCVACQSDMESAPTMANSAYTEYGMTIN